MQVRRAPDTMSSWRFASLGSGSKGNGTLVTNGSTCLLIDCGFTLKQTRLRLQRLGVAAEDLTAILVTHEHSDHIQGVLPLARKFDIPVYCSHGTARARHGRRKSAATANRDVSLQNTDDISLFIVDGQKRLRIGDAWVQPVSVPHDAREPLQYIVGCENFRIGFLTDIGHITPHVESCYQACDAILVESNHDSEMLSNSRYPAHLIQRVGGLHGHLSNEQTVKFLERVLHANLQHVVIGHVSEQNNSEACIRSAFSQLGGRLNKLTFASQEEGTDWIEVSAPVGSS